MGRALRRERREDEAGAQSGSSRVVIRARAEDGAMLYPAVNSWMFPRELGIVGSMRAAAAAGFEGIEIGMTPGDEVDRGVRISADSAVQLSDGRSAETSTAAELWSTGVTVRVCAELKRIASDLNLRIAGLSSGAWLQMNYASPTAADRGAARDLTIRMLDRAAELDAGAILVIPAMVGRFDSPTMNVRYSDALQRTFESLAELKFEAEARRVAIGIENVWNRFLLSPVEFADLLDRVNSPWVGAYFDIGNVMPFGYPQDWIETLGRRIVRVHAKDYDLTKSGKAGFCALREGSVDWSGVMVALRGAGYEGPVTYEGAGEAADIARSLKQLLQHGGAGAGHA